MGIQNLKRNIMLEHIRNCKASEMTVEEYCRQNGLTTKSYWYYHKVLGDELENKMSLTMPVKTKPVFEELKAPVPVSDCNSIALIKAGPITVEISDATSDDLIFRLMRAIKNA